MKLADLLQSKMPFGPTAAIVLAAVSVVGRAMSSSGNWGALVLPSEIFGLLVSWLTAYVLERRVYSWLVGLIFGGYLGLIYSEQALTHLRHADDLTYGSLLAAVFTIFGIGLSVMIKHLRLSVLLKGVFNYRPSAVSGTASDQDL